VQPSDKQANQTFAATVKGPRVTLLSDTTAANSLTLKAETVDCAAAPVLAGLVTEACAAAALSER
jgi:hypothetical protein